MKGGCDMLGFLPPICHNVERKGGNRADILGLITDETEDSPDKIDLMEDEGEF